MWGGGGGGMFYVQMGYMRLIQTSHEEEINDLMLT